MIHKLTKTNIIMSNWIQDSRMNWMKHRLLDYREPIDTIKILKEYRNSKLSWNAYFSGKNVEYIEYIYRKMYEHQSFSDEQLEILKKNIDHILNKADKLIIFA
jgi:hypothetical protein